MLATATVVLLAGCGMNDGTSPTTAASTPSSSTTTPPRHSKPDLRGLDESLVLVVGGEYDTRAAATDASGSFGDMQGFYVVPSADFRLKTVYKRLTPVRAEIDCSDGAASVKVAPAIGATKRSIKTACRADIEGPASVLVEARLDDDARCARPSGCLAEAEHVIGHDLGLDPGSWLLVTAFRTLKGAEAFIDMATAYGFGDLAAVRAVRVRGSADIGLGQEMAPDGSGALEIPLPNQRSYQ